MYQVFFKAFATAIRQQESNRVHVGIAFFTDMEFDFVTLTADGAWRIAQLLCKLR